MSFIDGSKLTPLDRFGYESSGIGYANEPSPSTVLSSDPYPVGTSDQSYAFGNFDREEDRDIHSIAHTGLQSRDGVLFPPPHLLVQEHSPLDRTEDVEFNADTPVYHSPPRAPCLPIPYPPSPPSLFVQSHYHLDRAEDVQFNADTQVDNSPLRAPPLLPVPSHNPLQRLLMQKLSPLLSSPLTQHDFLSDPNRRKAFLCRVFSIQFADVIDLTGHINRHRFIAAGGSGEVWEGSWIGLDKNLFINTPNELPVVAVKLVRLPPLRDEGKNKRYKMIKRELEIWSKIDHPHILPLIGTARIESDANLPAFISPWMENGNVMEFLIQNPSFPASGFLTDIIKGLHYLHTHTPVIVHGDIKGANVLINHRKEACLSDFGLSRFVVDNTLWRTTATHANGTLRWMAPELIDGDIVAPTIATDIYAFGMTCYEILCKRSPFSATNDFKVMKKVTNGQRPERMESCHSDEIWSIMTRCWAQEQEDRPSTEETLELILKHDTPSGATLKRYNVMTNTQDRTKRVGVKGQKADAAFVCPVPDCGRTCTRRFNLKVHMHSHNEWKPFTCDGCQQQFARIDALNRHLCSEDGAHCAQVQKPALLSDDRHDENVEADVRMLAED